MPVLLTLLFAIVSVMPAAAQNWPQFRGSRAGIAADDARLPETWSATENIAWQLDVPGRSWSSPVVWGNHVFVVTAVNVKQPAPTLNAVGTYLARSLGGPMTGGDISQPVDEHRWVLYDVDFQTGKIKWERVVHAAVPLQPVHQKNSYASETPITDGERVYVYLGYVGLFAFDMAGKPLWSKPMPAVKMRTGWGSASSPVLHNGRLFIVNDNEERSFVAAFDAKSGAELWRTDREGEASNWSTPFVWQNDVRTEIVTTGSKGVRSYDTDGKLLWQLTGMTSIHAVTPIASHGLLFVSSGYFPDSKRPTYAIKPGATGDISLKGEERSNAFIAWSHPTLAPAYPSPLVVGDQVLHADGSRLRHLERSEDRRGDLRPPADRRRCRHVHRIAVGLQREDFCRQRRRRYVRAAGRQGVQAPRTQLSRRDDAREPRDCQWQCVYPDGDEALSHRYWRWTGE